MLTFLLSLSAQAADLPPQVLAWDPVVIAVVEPGFTTEGTPLASYGQLHRLDRSPIVGLMAEPLAGQGHARWTLALGGGTQAPAVELEQAWVPVEDLSAASEDLRSRLEAGGWAPFPEVDCGAGCALWVPEDLWRYPNLAVVEAPDALRLVALQGIEDNVPAALWQSALEATGALSDTPAAASLLAEDSRNAVLLRITALPAWTMRYGTFAAGQAVVKASPETRWTLWWAATGYNVRAIASMAPEALEFQDALLRETEAGWQAIATLTERGAALRGGARAQRLPTWTGPTPLLELSLVGDVEGLLAASPLLPEPEMGDPRALAQLSKLCGPACVPLVLSSPWTYVATLLAGLPEDLRPEPTGVEALRFTFAGQPGAPEVGLAIRLRSRAAAVIAERQLNEILATKEGMLPGDDMAVARRGPVVLVGIGVDPAEGFGKSARVAPGLAFQLYEAPEPLRMRLNLDPAVDGFVLQSRVEAGALVVDAGGPPPPATVAFTPASPSPTACAQELRDFADYAEVMAHASQALVADARPALEAERLPALERCAAQHPDDALVASALAMARLGAGVNLLVTGDVQQARPVFERSCAENVPGGCLGLTLMPEVVPDPTTLPRSDAGRAVPVRWVSVVGARVHLPGGRACPVTAVPCFAPTLKGEPVGVWIVAGEDVSWPGDVLQVLRGEHGGQVTLAVLGATGVQGLRLHLAPPGEPPPVVRVAMRGGELWVNGARVERDALLAAVDQAAEDTQAMEVYLSLERATMQDLVDLWSLLDRPETHPGLPVSLDLGTR
ncbi:MAG: hypothetical protein H6739_35680 [Alphaproteobacteria bacterium]|nr:hypothetical protein [Alphaproteobacteria bacterium]